MVNFDPFLSSNALAEWTAGIIESKEIEKVKKWRMLEYWMQVELYRAVEEGKAGKWRYLGDYEQPYFTDAPKSGSRYNIKWVDMILAEPSLLTPKRVIWIELKDVGRSEHTLQNNLKGIGHDLCALYRINPKKTKEIWVAPPAHVIDRGRTKEWSACASSIGKDEHLISQIVIIPLSTINNNAKEIERIWLDSFKARAGLTDIEGMIKISSASAGGFAVFTVVSSPEKRIG